MLAAVALIGAVVALRVAQAQTPPKRIYEISVTPNKVLEGGEATIKVKVTVSRAFTSAEITADEDSDNVYLYIANESDGDGCDFISSCNEAANVSTGNDLTNGPPTIDASKEFGTNTTTVTYSFDISPNQDSMIESDEKI